jgi:hypothetical protein
VVAPTVVVKRRSGLLMSPVQEFADHFRREHPDTPVQTPYRCPAAYGWHLTTSAVPKPAVTKPEEKKVNVNSTIRIVRVIEVPINKIRTDWDVRLQAGANDVPRVELLQGLYRDGKVKDPIEVTPLTNDDMYRLVEGRTRFAAQLANDAKTVRIGILSPATDDEYITYAYLCNSTGAKPPALEDLKVTVDRLMRLGQTEKQIKTGPLAQVESNARLKLACDQTRSNINKQGVAAAKKMLATLAIADPDERMKAAAKANGITVSALRKAVNGGPGPGGKGNTLLNEIKKDLGGVQNTRRTWLRNKISWITDRHFNGTPTDQVLEVYSHLIKQLQDNLKLMADAKEELEIRANGGLPALAKAAKAGK